MKTSQLTLHREIIAVCSEIRPKHINTLCEHNVEFVDVKRDGTQSTQWGLRASQPLSPHYPSGNSHIDCQKVKRTLASLGAFNNNNTKPGKAYVLLLGTMAYSCGDPILKYYRYIIFNV
jgi:hypothetical protein